MDLRIQRGGAPGPPIVPPPGASLVEELDKRVMVQLWDGSMVVGILRSIDVHGNFVMEGTVRRVVCGALYHDKARGLEVIRGENVVLIGRIDPASENEGLELVSEDRIKKAQADERIAQRLEGNIQKQFDFLDL